MNFDGFDGHEPWLRALDMAIDARDRLRSAHMIDRTGPQARLARHDLAAAFGTLLEGLTEADAGDAALKQRENRHNPAGI